MGDYVNPSFRKFQLSINSDIYIDKSELISVTNRLVDTEDRFVCISRPRRFGKTMGLNMLAAYYGSVPCDLFENLKIAKHPSYEKHLNQYNVVKINMQDFLSKTDSIDELLSSLQSSITEELVEEYPDVKYRDKSDFIRIFMDLYRESNRPFVILIDEWDCIFRRFKDDFEAQRKYLDFLRLWLKDKGYIGFAYMTGILPIKKYGTQSELNMFNEYSMIRPFRFLEYFGFTANEVESLSKEYNMDFEEVKKWYNGYFVDLGTPIYNPRSVNSSLQEARFDSYWNKTETYESLREYIRMDFDGLREKVISLIAGSSVEINERSFVNDMTTFNSADNVLTLLVHLGYLSYDFDKKTVRIPNHEVKNEFISSIKELDGWETVITAIRKSQDLLQAIWTGDSETVARGIEIVHQQNTSILEYNDENSLSCVISLALFSSSEYYTQIRELPTGKGFSDIAFIPRKKHADKPALLVELKWDKNATSAIDQIKDKNYPAVLAEYQGNLLLVGVNYDKETKEHECIIEKWV